MESTNQSSEREVSFKVLAQHVRDYRVALRRARLFIALCTLAGLLLGLAAAFIVKPLYTAQTSFVLESSGKAKLGGYGGLAAQFGLNFGESSGVFQDDDNIMALLRSRIMIERALLESQNSIGLADRYLTFTGLRKRWEDDDKLGQFDFQKSPPRLRDSVISLIYRKLLEGPLVVEKPDKKLDIIRITVTTIDEGFSKAFSEALLQNVSAFYIETQTKKSQENVKILRHQVDSVRVLLNQAIYGVAASTEANPNINPAFQSLKVPAQKRMIDVELNKAILIELVKNLELAEISLRKETPLIQIIDVPILPLEKKDVGALEGLILGGLLGLAFAFIFVLGKKYLSELVS